MSKIADLLTYCRGDDEARVSTAFVYESSPACRVFSVMKVVR